MFHYPFNPHVFPRLCPSDSNLSDFFERFIKRPMLDSEIRDNIFAGFVSEMNSYSFEVREGKEKSTGEKKLHKNIVDDFYDFRLWEEELEIEPPRSLSM